MKIKRNTINKKVVISAIFVLALVAGFSVFAIVSNRPTPPAEDLNQTANIPTDQDKAPATTPPTDETSDSPKTPIENDKQDTPPAGTVVTTITSVTTYDNEIKISSLIESITNTGTCKISLKKSGVVVTRSSGIQALPNASTCKGFTIPRTELPDGVWTITLSVTINNKTGTATKEYEIK
ncbi:MAG: hypothetical protein HZB75_00090 [Candidatus Saccharibacteria bacterium]|nr:MAG: hypothetical protein HZB75_00090 [Candidatus Saccharibacteria bacterium]